MCTFEPSFFFFVQLSCSLQCEKKRLEFGLLKCFQADEMLYHISSVIPCGLTQQNIWNSHDAAFSILVQCTQHLLEIQLLTIQTVVNSISTGLKLLRWSRCSVLVPLTEAVGFFRAKNNPQYAFLRKGSKAVCPKSVCLEVVVFGQNYWPFLAQLVPPFTTGVSGGDTWRCK